MLFAIPAKPTSFATDASTSKSTKISHVKLLFGRGLVEEAALALVSVAISAAQEVYVAKDWDAVADVIATRMDELELTQQQLAQRAGVSLQTVRELQHNLQPRKRTPRTLQAMSSALGLHPDHLATVLSGGRPINAAVDDGAGAELLAMKAQLADLSRRLEAVEQQLRRD
ncbi:hypothetical protein SACE_1139 [Saccharopolyspora erythraea NRRL 2338]|uniref:HTH cro/C1-type domain-containing protein n=1 Tax=Saccharopolyspora erythraea (strain ATCC 11635 / DSM 40517 / JCM 4748 / NBRC 13426 / NCIMB 8594 / NRRL 2338) TaxID=405948 RepID=A4F8U5_SACEN|nr:hypothetical protein SACE_1139 [Saccharopolyspora erythraea NRRL 2338]